MSYCRWLESDCYIYDDSHYGLLCASCLLNEPYEVYSTVLKINIWTSDSFSCGYDYDKMLAHVAEHRAAGHYIPADVDERLIFERDCSHEFNSEGICKHCWGHVGDSEKFK